MNRRHQATLIYDGDCGICQWTAEWVRKRDRQHRLHIVPFQAIEPGEVAPGLTRADCARAVHLITPEGRRFRAARAMFETLRLLSPPWRWIGTLCAPFSPLFEPAYHLIARSRHRLSRWLGLDACRLPEPTDPHRPSKP
ncbi:thiol-disulfide oxidoreductase DCC family protein [Ardenticatena maritima]|uniref:Thiol-disulfide oxidoreductase n=2 Tax=Ardenticatena maritima TaxID=872965 RepID=A0A0P6YAC7_9CHLR|nr:DUF393 domain-containing protein [Ardenticatena maritima]KPL86269.1 hypothetical protein SE16_13015 [Ardenticatena maritima]